MLHRHINPYRLGALSESRASTARQNMHGSILVTKLHLYEFVPGQDGCIGVIFCSGPCSDPDPPPTTVAKFQGTVACATFVTLVVPPLRLTIDLELSSAIESTIATKVLGPNKPAMGPRTSAKGYG